MKRRLRRILIAIALLGVLYGVLYEAVTQVGRGWWRGEPFHDGRPASFWADEIEQWHTDDPDWKGVRAAYTRRSAWPAWVQARFGESRWPGLLDGDPDALAVLQALAKHPSANVQDWARIGIERIDNLERGPYKLYRPDVIFTVELYEVDEALYQRVAKSRWYSMAEIEQFERVFLEEPAKAPTTESLFDLIGKQKLMMSVKDRKIGDGKEGLLLASTKEITCLPSPLQVRKGKTDPQKIEEGVTLRAHVQISNDRRFVRVKIIEKSMELQGIDKVSVLMDNNGTQASAEIPAIKEHVVTTPRTMPDGGGLLLPLQHRRKDSGRWLVVRITARIYIAEEEEMQIRAAAEK